MDSKPRQVVLRKVELDMDPYTVFCRIQAGSDYAFLLESIEGPEKLVEYSFIGFDPKYVFTSKDGVSSLIGPDGNEKVYESGLPLRILSSVVKSFEVDTPERRYIGGAVGYLSYDIIRNWEDIPCENKDDYGFPDMEMGIYLDGLFFDHVKGETYYHFKGEDRFPLIEKLFKKEYVEEPYYYSEPTTNIQLEDYIRGVEKSKEYIKAGDIFQVVPSRRFEFKVKGSLLGFYRKLREVNPSPYMYYLKMGERSIIGASPEMLVRVEDEKVETYPIAGTRPVVDDPEENIRLGKELIEDPKEMAEHVMLVDLARNDVGKVSKPGTVEVPNFLEVHQYSHVQHIVSRVTGQLKNSCTSYDALRSVFPAGTVSGAPKIRAMEIIDEIEPSMRGPYAGAVGFFSLNGNADFAITIRTLIRSGDRAYIQAGGGIVQDSVPLTEFEETGHKAMALLQAIRLSGGVLP
ncbi:anthranilate synthase component I family protein [Thermoproteota archaeon]